MEYEQIKLGNSTCSSFFTSCRQIKISQWRFTFLFIYPQLSWKRTTTIMLDQ